MGRRYWLQRISHEWEISSLLFEKGYLALGWRKFQNSDVLERSRKKKNGRQEFEALMERAGEKSRSRWNLWRFAQFCDGDIVVVPLPGKEFAVVTVEGSAFAVGELCGRTLDGQEEIDREGIRKSGGGYYDIGFLVKVNLCKKIERSYADSRLISRMKLRMANAEITDIGESVKEALERDRPVGVHDLLTTAVTEQVREVIRSYVTPDNLERILCWYMQKKGASSAWIPGKNETGKENGADADVIAEFEDLRVIFCIQVKKHEGVTDDWAVRQIVEYAAQKQRGAIENGYTYIPWAVTTAEFGEEAVEKARGAGVRLIGGTELIQMLIDCGFDTIDSALQKK